jgi:hypothetical protein
MEMETETGPSPAAVAVPAEKPVEAVPAPAQPVPAPAAPVPPPAPVPPVPEPEIPAAEESDIPQLPESLPPIAYKADPLNRLAWQFQQAGDEKALEEILKEKFPSQYEKWLKIPRHKNFRRWLLWYGTNNDPETKKAVKAVKYMSPKQTELYEQALMLKQPWNKGAKPVTLLKYVERLFGNDAGMAATVIRSALNAQDDVMKYIILAAKYVAKYKPPWSEEAVKRSLKRFKKYIVDPSTIPDDIAAAPIPQDEKVVEAYKREVHDRGEAGRVDKAIAWWNEKYAEIIKRIPDNMITSILGLTGGEAAQNMSQIKSARLIKEPYLEDYDKKIALFKEKGFNLYQQRLNFGFMRKVLAYVAHLASMPEGESSEWARQFGVTEADLSKQGPNFLMVEMILPYAYGISPRYVRIAKKNVGVKLVSKDQLEGGEGKKFELGDPEDWGAAGKRKKSDDDMGELSEVEIEDAMASARFYRFIALAMIAGKDMD